MRIPIIIWDRQFGFIGIAWRHILPACEREKMNYPCHQYLAGGCECCKRRRS
jgi:hypothetical protein